MNKRALCLVPGVLASVLFVSVEAAAGASGSADVACGSASVAWSAPNGAIAFNRGSGPLKEVISSAGESRTHSMLSNATYGYVTQAAAKTPDRPGWPTYCSTPLDSGQLQNGWAGAEQVNMGSIYTYLYSNGSQEYLYYQNGNNDGTNKGGQIADHAWSAVPYDTVTSWRDSNAHMYRLKNSAGHEINYVLYQFRWSQNSSAGGSNWSDGNICSTLLASLQEQTLGSSFAVNTWTYGSGTVNTGLNALYNGVYNQCSSGLGFWTGLGAGVSCLDFNGPCDEAGDEVTNCMATGQCNSSDHGIWTGQINSGATATTMSPDHIGGWSGHPYSGAGVAGSGVSVWAYDGNNTVQWNSAGNTYGCWF